MANVENARKDWWILYPFYGLKMLDKTDGISHPMLPNHSVVSRDHISAIVKRLKHPPLFKNADFLDPECESFIAIRTTRIAEKNLFDDTKDEAKFFASIIALIAFCNRYPFSCSLYELLAKRHSEDRLGISFDEGRTSFQRWGERAKARFVYFQPNGFQYTRKDLKKLLLNRDIGFGHLLLTKSSKVDPNLIGPLKTAILILGDALHQRDRSLRLLSCVTAMEILFKRESSYDLFKRRIPLILGKNTIHHLKFGKVIDARHDFVHKGVRVQDESLDFCAHRLAIASVIGYSYLADLFPSPKEMQKKLDLLDKGNAKEMAVLKRRIDNGFTKFSKIDIVKHHVVRDWY
jgi:hypothetical protein